ncbi:MAG: hypothetical protein A2091_02205 [Desulfuromonadales bacterium GWD2_61_12]|nr:MAG: hypothetical protein A2005_03585 [Desulfuromonadales bacterium GWC2_61_20]OGR36159.1 MAG: hypothetical protein A2091_02205 [Desulfuromonadales bacterium GWD2_61_12]HAD05016.1 hypothetical protein [Desulfuromonas sp.]HBT83039.1 hypothetical protein [Desulfuromonas sp.]
MTYRHLCTTALLLLSLLIFATTALAGSRTYYESGKVKTEYITETGQKPILKTFQENGKIHSIITYSGDQPERALWHDENGVLQSEELYVDASTRIVTFYDLVGNKITEETRVDGKRIKGRTFFPNGNTEKEYNFKDDKLNGPYILYFENGKIKAEFEYKDGVQI